MKRWVSALAATFLLLAMSPLRAQPSPAWSFVPAVVVVGPADDARIPTVHEAIDYWNRQLTLAGAGLRLPPPRLEVQPVPEAALQAMSRIVLQGVAAPQPVPAELQQLPGNLVIVLGQTEFVSFATGFFAGRTKRVVGIRDTAVPPLNLPNVAPNVIAHEIGHALGLGHNADPSLLMCGRPAPCRPPLYQSATPRWFSLNDEEFLALLRLYPK